LDVNDVNLQDGSLLTDDKIFHWTIWLRNISIGCEPFGGFLSNRLSFQSDTSKQRTTGLIEAGQ
jgi:hypothetical protein